MLSNFITKKLAQARYKILRDGTYYGEIPTFKGVWANAKSLEICRQELQEVFEDWLLLKIQAGDKIDGLRIGASRQLLAHA